ncbi:hypothetical protein JL720_2363 [Aureococcus anophagefferens]|nr:hypothetical protein JL720_2363 [Aureococcus anophagefferens]
MGASFAGSAGFVVRFDGQEGLEACVEKLLARAETRPLATAFVLNVLVVAPRDEGVPEAVRLVLAKKRRNDLGGDADDDGDESDGKAYAALFNSNTQPAAPSPVPRLNLGGDDAADGAYAVDWHRDATLGSRRARRRRRRASPFHALNATGILDLVALDVNFIEDWSSGACPADASHGGLNGCVADRFFLCAEKTLPAADAWPFIHCGYQYQKCLMLSR